jgi:hypothetical protein
MEEFRSWTVFITVREFINMTNYLENLSLSLCTCDFTIKVYFSIFCLVYKVLPKCS